MQVQNARFANYFGKTLYLRRIAQHHTSESGPCEGFRILRRPADQGDRPQRPPGGAGSIWITKSSSAMQQQNALRLRPNERTPDSRFHCRRNQTDAVAVLGVALQPQRRFGKWRIHEDAPSPIRAQPVIEFLEGFGTDPIREAIGGAWIKVENAETVQNPARREPRIYVDLNAEVKVPVVADPLGRDRRHGLRIWHPARRSVHCRIVGGFGINPRQKVVADGKRLPPLPVEVRKL